VTTKPDADPVARFMRALAAETDPEPPGPDPYAILRRARLMERVAKEQARVDRAARPILLAGLFGPFAVAVVVSTLPALRGGATAVAIGILCAVASSLALRLALVDD